MANSYESLKIILDRLLRNNVLSGLSYESVIDYTIDFLDIVGIPSAFEEKFETLEIETYRAKLPCDFAEDIQVVITSPRHSRGITATDATDTFHNNYSQMRGRQTTGVTYKIKNGYIFTSEERGCLTLSYRAIATDEEGYPLIPSDRAFLKALELYIKKQYYTILWEESKLEDKKLENVKQEYAWAVGQCETSMRRLTLSKAEALFNSLRTLIPRDNEFSHRFANIGNKEFIKRH